MTETISTSGIYSEELKENNLAFQPRATSLLVSIISRNSYDSHLSFTPNIPSDNTVFSAEADSVSK
jgi:hypothetical protein